MLVEVNLVQILGFKRMFQWPFTIMVKMVWVNRPELAINCEFNFIGVRVKLYCTSSHNSLTAHSQTMDSKQYIYIERRSLYTNNVVSLTWIETTWWLVDWPLQGRNLVNQMWIDYWFIIDVIQTSNNRPQRY